MNSHLKVEWGIGLNNSVQTKSYLSYWRDMTCHISPIISLLLERDDLEQGGKEEMQSGTACPWTDNKSMRRWMGKKSTSERQMEMCINILRFILDSITLCILR